MRRRFISILSFVVVTLSLVACDESAMRSSDFSCNDMHQLSTWRTRVFNNFSAVGAIANAHDGQAKDPEITLRRLRDLQLQLGHYFLNEPMPDCMHEAIRIYVDGTRRLQKSDDHLLVAMKQFQVTVNRFTEAVQIAKPEWAQQTTPGKN